MIAEMPSADVALRTGHAQIGPRCKGEGARLFLLAGVR